MLICTATVVAASVREISVQTSLRLAASENGAWRGRRRSKRFGTASLVWAYKQFAGARCLSLRAELKYLRMAVQVEYFAVVVF